MMTDDPAWALAQHVCRTSYADLPVSAVESARRDILDTFGCMLGGSGSPGIGELFAVVSRWGGLAESRVLLRLIYTVNKVVVKPRGVGILLCKPNRLFDEARLFVCFVIRIVPFRRFPKVQVKPTPGYVTQK